MRLLLAEEMRRLDQEAIHHWGIPGILLMEQAAMGLYRLLLEPSFPDWKSCLIFCGPGNNGGDGLALARLLHGMGRSVAVCLLCPDEQLKGDALLQWNLIQNYNIPRLNLDDALKRKDVDLLVDCLFGTGLKRPLKGDYAKVIQAINHWGLPVVSADIPSGISGDSGPMGDFFVKADYTVSFGFPKVHNLLYPSYLHQGKLLYCRLSFPAEALESMEGHIEASFPAKFPEIPRDSYKSSRGYGLVIGGSSLYRGAPFFVAMAAMQSGAGYVHLVAPECVEPGLAPFPEIVFHRLSDEQENPDGWWKLTKKVKWAVIGPGLGSKKDIGERIRSWIPQLSLPLVLDGDALSHMENSLSLLSDRRAATILTPHPGEASTLLHLPISEVLSDPVECARRIAKLSGAWVVLKQAHSIICSPQGKVFLNCSGSPTLSTAGTGDVLAGMIGSFLGWGMEAGEACRSAVFIHGLAGEDLESTQGVFGGRAMDLLEVLPKTLKRFSENYEELKKDYNQRIHYL